MSSSLKWASLVGAILAPYSCVLFMLLEPNLEAAYVSLPGAIFGVYAAWLFSATSPHGGEYAVLFTVTGIVNFFFYTTLTYVLLRVGGRIRKKLRREH